MLHEILQGLFHDRYEAPWFSLVVDETRYISGSGQLSDNPYQASLPNKVGCSIYTDLDIFGKDSNHESLSKCSGFKAMMEKFSKIFGLKFNLHGL